MSSTWTIITSLVGGGILGTVGGWISSWRTGELTRRGRARLLHEDFYRLQSTVSRLFFETSAEGEWGPKFWLASPLAAKDDQQDVVAHLRKRERFGNCAGALGWGEFLREAYGVANAPDDDSLKTIYWRLDLGRKALSDIADLPYSAHHPERVVTPASRVRNQDAELEAVPPSHSAVGH